MITIDIDKIKAMVQKELDSGESYRTLGKKMDIDYGTIWHMMQGDKEPQLVTLNKLAAYFRIPTISLFCGEDYIVTEGLDKEKVQAVNMLLGR